MDSKTDEVNQKIIERKHSEPVFKRDQDETITNIFELDKLKTFLLPEIVDIVFSYVFDHRKFCGRIDHSFTIAPENDFLTADTYLRISTKFQDGIMNIINREKILNFNSDEPIKGIELIRLHIDNNLVERIKIDYIASQSLFIHAEISGNTLFFYKSDHEEKMITFTVFDMNGNFVRTFDIVEMCRPGALRFRIISEGLLCIFSTYEHEFRLYDTLDGRLIDKHSIFREELWGRNVGYCQDAAFHNGIIYVLDGTNVHKIHTLDFSKSQRPFWSPSCSPLARGHDDLDLDNAPLMQNTILKLRYDDQKYISVSEIDFWIGGNNIYTLYRGCEKTCSKLEYTMINIFDIESGSLVQNATFRTNHSVNGAERKAGGLLNNDADEGIGTVENDFGRQAVLSINNGICLLDGDRIDCYK